MDSFGFMDDFADNYELKPGEVLNGGYTVNIGDFTLRIIGGYEPNWDNVYSNESMFRDYQGNERKKLQGKKFSLKITTGGLVPEDYNALVEELKKEYFYVFCPDYDGLCYCENIPASLTQANFRGTRYKVSFTLIAKDIIKPADGL